MYLYIFTYILFCNFYVYNGTFSLYIYTVCYLLLKEENSLRVDTLSQFYSSLQFTFFLYFFCNKIGINDFSCNTHTQAQTHRHGHGHGHIHSHD